MKTWDESRQAIYTHFIAEWANHLTYFLEGQKEPDFDQQTTPFVVLRICPKRVEQLALADPPPKRAYGEVEITLFTPFSVGAKTRMTALDKLSAIFAVTGVGEIVFRGASILSLVEGKDWRSQTVVANFYFELSLTGD